MDMGIWDIEKGQMSRDVVSSSENEIIIKTLTVVEDSIDYLSPRGTKYCSTRCQQTP